MRYNETVTDHFEHPRNCGSLADATVVGEASNPVCGDRLKLYLRVDDAGRIEAATFQAQGCPAAIAAGSMTTVLLVGKDVAAARALRDADVAAALGGLPASKLHCSVLAEDAIVAALGSTAS